MTKGPNSGVAPYPPPPQWRMGKYVFYSTRRRSWEMFQAMLAAVLAKHAVWLIETTDPSPLYDFPILQASSAALQACLLGGLLTWVEAWVYQEDNKEATEDC